MNAANIRKPMRLYMPEHAMSTANGIVDPSGLVIVIVGFPYSLERVEGTPNAFTIVWLASELMTDRVEPKVYRISVGGGVRKKRKAIGKASWRSVCGLNRIRVNPATKIGNASMWCSRGVNV